MQTLSLSKNEFTLFQKLLIEESGLYFDKHQTDSLQLALGERLRKRGYSSYQEYYSFLKFHPEGRLEIQELLDLITIGETYFFRNHPQFDALIKSVLPEIIQKKMCSIDKSIRVWSAGCSKGDESYSVAIAIMEVLPDYEQWDISILGTDINRNSIAAAREATYIRKDVSHLTQEQLNSYFHKRGTNYILDKKVKRMVRFEHHNLAKGPFILQGMRDLDIILCRNVTIYFDTQTTKRIIDNFYNCLSWDRYLFIGHAETLWQVSNKFETIEFPRTFIYKKAPSPVKEGAKPFMSVPDIRLEKFEWPFSPSPSPLPQRDKVRKTREVSPSKESQIPLAGTKKDIDLLYKEAKKLYTKKRYEEALSLFNEIITKDKGFIGAHLARATILANQAEYKEAIKELNNIITVDNLYIEAYYLLGILSCKIKDFDEAETQFRKVIYINPDIALAYFNLGNIYSYQGRLDRAEREFKNAALLLKKRGREESIAFSEDFTVDFLLRACKNSIREINKRGRTLYG